MGEGPPGAPPKQSSFQSRSERPPLGFFLGMRKQQAHVDVQPAEHTFHRGRPLASVSQPSRRVQKQPSQD